MTTTITRDNAGLRDALYALSLAQPVPNAAMLDDVIRQYPAYASELTEAAIAIALDALVEDDDFAPQADADTSPAVLRAMSRFHNRLHAIKTERAPETKGAAR